MEEINKTNKYFLRNVIIKGIILFIILNFIFIGINQFPIGRISLYNIVFPGRDRFPFGENPSQSYNLTINNIDAMFSSLKIDRQKKKDTEFRVFIAGDSSVWGSLLSNSDSLTGQINQKKITTCDGKTVQAFNLGYPTMSVLKDLLIIDKALSYQPDLLIWMITLESFPEINQSQAPLLVNNPLEVRKLIDKYSISNKYQEPTSENNYLNQTLIGQRRNIADLLRLQVFGILWAATGIDQQLNVAYTPAKLDYDQDDSFYGKSEHIFADSELSFDILDKAVQNINVPIIMINEPILISSGKNSEIRYNYYYPRWAYDQYRLIINKSMSNNKVPFYDFYDTVPDKFFTNSAIHMNPAGEAILANKINKILSEINCQK
jgi:hypothetical protein